MPMSTKISIKNEIDISGIYRYGSNTSDDIDLFVELTTPPVTSSDFEKLDGLRDVVRQLTRDGEQVTKSNKPIDYSFIYINDSGVVEWCEYDDLEECNNALYHTFNHHQYNNTMVGDNPIKKELTQNVSFKIVKVIRQLLTYLSRTSYRSDVKRLLKYGSFKERLEFVLGLVSDSQLSDLGTFEKNLSDIEILKDIAFGFIQLYALIDGEVVFCKRDACLRFPDLVPFILKHKDVDWTTLESFILETFNMLSMNVEIFDDMDAVRFVGDAKACLNKEERVIDCDIKQLK